MSSKDENPQKPDWRDSLGRIQAELKKSERPASEGLVVPEKVVEQGLVAPSPEVPKKKDEKKERVNRRLIELLEKEIKDFEKHLRRTVKKEIGKKDKGSNVTVLENLKSNLWVQEKFYKEATNSSPEKTRLEDNIRKTKEDIQAEKLKQLKLTMLKMEHDVCIANGPDESTKAKQKFEEDWKKIEDMAKELGLSGDEYIGILKNLITPLEERARRDVKREKKTVKKVAPAEIEKVEKKKVPAATDPRKKEAVNETARFKYLKGTLAEVATEFINVKKRVETLQTEIQTKEKREFRKKNVPLNEIRREKIREWEGIERRLKGDPSSLPDNERVNLERDKKSLGLEIDKLRQEIAAQKKRKEELEKRQSSREKLRESFQIQLGELRSNPGSVDAVKEAEFILGAPSKTPKPDDAITVIAEPEGEVVPETAPSPDFETESQGDRISSEALVYVGEQRASLNENLSEGGKDRERRIEWLKQEIETRKSLLSDLQKEKEQVEQDLKRNEESHTLSMGKAKNVFGSLSRSEDVSAGHLKETEMYQSKLRLLDDEISSRTNEKEKLQQQLNKEIESLTKTPDAGQQNPEPAVGVQEPETAELELKQERDRREKIDATHLALKEMLSKDGFDASRNGGTSTERFLDRFNRNKDDFSKLNEEEKSVVKFFYRVSRQFESDAELNGIDISDAEGSSIDSFLFALAAKLVDAGKAEVVLSGMRNIPDEDLEELLSSPGQEPAPTPDVPQSPPTIPKPELPKVDFVKPLSLDDVENKTPSDAVLKKFEALGIRQADLLAVPGFSDLKTEGQQLFVVESLLQAAARNVDDTALDTAKSGLLKGFHLTTKKKELAGQVSSGGLKKYGSELTQLIEGVKMSGLDMIEMNGKLHIAFLSLPDNKADAQDDDFWKEGLAFNEFANRFATIPHEWSLEGASKKDREKYDTAKASYDEAYQRLADSIDRNRGENPKSYEVVRNEYSSLRVADNRVRLVQHLQAHPEAGEYLESLKGRNTLMSFFKTTGAERGMYFAGGMAGRLAFASTLGIATAPLVASIIGGVMGYKRAKETLVDQDRKARRGIESAPPTGANATAGWFRKLIGKPTEISKEKLEASKRAMAHATASEKDVHDGRKRGLADRLDIINERVAKLSADDTEGMKRELKNLAARVDSVKKKMDADLVSFGDGAEGMRSRIHLLEALSRAEMNIGVFADTDGEKEKNTAYRFERMFGEKQRKEESRIQSARSDYRWFEAKKGAVMSGTIALLGAGVAQGVREVSDWVQHGFHGVPTPTGSGVGVTSHEVAAKAATKIKGGTTPSSTVPHTPTGASAHEIADKAVKTAEKIKSGASADSTAQHVSHRTDVPGRHTASEVLKGTVEHKASEAGSKAVEAVGKEYIETAKTGEGVTQLARRALSGYIGQDPNLKGLTPEQKVFIEDYLQKKVSHAGTLKVDDKVNFTKDLMDEAIGKAKGLSEAQIRNLHQYSEQVREFRTGTPSGAVHQTVRTMPVAEAPASPKVPTEALDAATPKGTNTQAVKDAMPTPNVPSNASNMPANAEVIGTASVDGKPSVLWSPREDSQMFGPIGRMPAKDVPEIVIRAVRNPFGEHGMDPRRAREVGDLFIEARRRQIIPRYGERLPEFLDRAGRSHDDPDRAGRFFAAAQAAKRWGKRG